MLILVGGMIPSGMVVPGDHWAPTILDLPITWQVPTVLIIPLVAGSSSGMIATFAYLTVGLFHLPIFHGGVTIEYIQSPGFGYLAGFIPASWLCGQLVQRKIKLNIIRLTTYALIGLGSIHLFGSLNLIIGEIMNRWTEPLSELLFRYSFSPLPSQMIFCTAIAFIALSFRSILFIE